MRESISIRFTTIQAEEGTSLRLGIPSWDWCFGLHLEISIRVI